MSELRKLYDTLAQINEWDAPVEEGHDVRKYTNMIHDAMDGGVMDPRAVADAALSWLSESSVEEMARANDWLYALEPDEDDEDDETDLDFEFDDDGDDAVSRFHRMGRMGA